MPTSRPFIPFFLARAILAALASSSLPPHKTRPQVPPGSSETIGLYEKIENMDELASSDEHVRIWWFPQTDKVRIDISDHTREVCWTVLL